MGQTAIRISDTEVQFEKTLYSFAQKDEADAFEHCLVDASVEACVQRHQAISSRPALPDEQADDQNRGGEATPSLGGMP